MNDILTFLRMIYDVFDALCSRRVAGGERTLDESYFINHSSVDTFFRLFVSLARLRRQTIFERFCGSKQKISR